MYTNCRAMADRAMTQENQKKPVEKGEAGKNVTSGGGEASGSPQAAVQRRAPAIKEVIPLAWKLVGTSAGTPVTLLKCIERKDAEVQMARLEAEGYYQRLEIFGAEEKVPLSSTLNKARKKVIDDATNLAGARKATSVPAKSPGGPGKGSKRATAASKSNTVTVKMKKTARPVAKSKTRAGSSAESKRAAKTSKPKKSTTKTVKRVVKKTSASKKKTAQSNAKAMPKASKKRASASKTAKAKKATRKRK